MAMQCLKLYLTKTFDITLYILVNGPDDADTGYMVEAALEFPEYLHNKGNQFPPGP